MTSSTPSGTNELGQTFQRAWELLLQNLIIVLPGFVLSLFAIVPVLLFLGLGIAVGSALGVAFQTPGVAQRYPELITLGIVFAALFLVAVLVCLVIFAVAHRRALREVLVVESF